MSPRLPELIEPDRMAETGRFLQGTISISKMKRLVPLLFKDNTKNTGSSDDGEVDVELVFGVDAAGQLNVKGTLETDVTLQCQRCMQAMNLHIEEKISLAIVFNSQQANELPLHYEPLLLGEEELVSLPALIEDELLLALPSVPLHPEGECQLAAVENTAKGNEIQDEELQQSESEAKRKNPFAVLEQLKKD